MKKQLKMWVIGLLAVAGLVLLAGEPIDESRWFVVKLWTAVGGFACWCVCALLWRVWNIKEYDESDEQI